MKHEIKKGLVHTETLHVQMSDWLALSLNLHHMEMRGQSKKLVITKALDINGMWITINNLMTNRWYSTVNL